MSLSDLKEYWEHFGHNEGGERFSTLAQINRDNVGQLTEAWTFEYGGKDGYSHQVTPIMVDDGSGHGNSN